MAVHVRYNYWYISLPSSAKQQQQQKLTTRNDQSLRCVENVNHDGYFFNFFVVANLSLFPRFSSLI